MAFGEDRQNTLGQSDLLNPKQNQTPEINPRDSQTLDSIIASDAFANASDEDKAAVLDQAGRNLQAPVFTQKDIYKRASVSWHLSSTVKEQTKKLHEALSPATAFSSRAASIPANAMQDRPLAADPPPGVVHGQGYGEPDPIPLSQEAREALSIIGQPRAVEYAKTPEGVEFGPEVQPEQLPHPISNLGTADLDPLIDPFHTLGMVGGDLSMRFGANAHKAFRNMLRHGTDVVTSVVSPQSTKMGFGFAFPEVSEEFEPFIPDQTTARYEEAQRTEEARILHKATKDKRLDDLYRIANLPNIAGPEFISVVGAPAIDLTATLAAVATTAAPASLVVSSAMSAAGFGPMTAAFLGDLLAANLALHGTIDELSKLEGLSLAGQETSALGIAKVIHNKGLSKLLGYTVAGLGGLQIEPGFPSLVQDLMGADGEVDPTKITNLDRVITALFNTGALKYGRIPGYRPGHGLSASKPNRLAAEVDSFISKQDAETAARLAQIESLRKQGLDPTQMVEYSPEWRAQNPGMDPYVGIRFEDIPEVKGGTTAYVNQDGRLVVIPDTIRADLEAANVSYNSAIDETDLALTARSKLKTSVQIESFMVEYRKTLKEVEDLKAVISEIEGSGGSPSQITLSLLNKQNAKLDKISRTLATKRKALDRTKSGKALKIALEKQEAARLRKKKLEQIIKTNIPAVRDGWDVRSGGNYKQRVEEIHKDLPVFGVDDLESLSNTLDTGIPNGTSLDLTSGKTNTINSPITVVAPSAAKGKKVSASAQFESVGEATPGRRVIVNMEAMEDLETEEAIKRLKDIASNNLDTSFEAIRNGKTIWARGARQTIETSIPRSQSPLVRLTKDPDTSDIKLGDEILFNGDNPEKPKFGKLTVVRIREDGKLYFRGTEAENIPASDKLSHEMTVEEFIDAVLPMDKFTNPRRTGGSGKRNFDLVESWKRDDTTELDQIETQQGWSPDKGTFEHPVGPTSEITLKNGDPIDKVYMYVTRDTYDNVVSSGSLKPEEGKVLRAQAIPDPAVRPFVRDKSGKFAPEDYLLLEIDYQSVEGWKLDRFVTDTGRAPSQFGAVTLDKGILRSNLRVIEDPNLAKRRRYYTPTTLAERHRELVKRAINDGDKYIPENVLSEYPDLLKELEISPEDAAILSSTPRTVQVGINTGAGVKVANLGGVLVDVADENGIIHTMPASGVTKPIVRVMMDWTTAEGPAGKAKTNALLSKGWVSVRSADGTELVSPELAASLDITNDVGKATLDQIGLWRGGERGPAILSLEEVEMLIKEDGIKDIAALRSWLFSTERQVTLNAPFGLGTTPHLDNPEASNLALNQIIRARQAYQLQNAATVEGAHVIDNIKRTVGAPIMDLRNIVGVPRHLISDWGEARRATGGIDPVRIAMDAQRKAHTDPQYALDWEQNFPQIYQAAGEMNRWFDDMRIKWIGHKRHMYTLQISPSAADALDDITIRGDDINVVAERYLIPEGEIKGMLDDIDEIKTWGIDDYITHVQVGNIRFLDGETGSVMAVGTTRYKAKQELMEYIENKNDRWRGIIEDRKEKDLPIDAATLKKEHGIVLDVEGNPVYMPEDIKLEIGAYRSGESSIYASTRIPVKDQIASDAVVADKVNEILKSAGVKKEFSQQEIIEFRESGLELTGVRYQKSVPSDPTRPRKVDPEGLPPSVGQNIFDIAHHINNVMNKRIHLEPIRATLNDPWNKLPVEVQERSINYKKVVTDQLEAYQRGVSDPITDAADDMLAKVFRHFMNVPGAKVLEKANVEGLFSKTVKAAKILTSYTLLPRIAGGIFNYAYGSLNTWSQVGTAAWKRGNELFETEAGQKLLSRNYAHLGIDLAIDDGLVRGTRSAWDPMTMFTWPEKKVRSVGFLSNYAIAKESFGMSEEAATLYGQLAVAHQQGIYDLGSFNKIGRTPIMKVPMQFKQFMVRQLEMLNSSSPKQMARYVYGMAALGGPGTLLYMASALPIVKDWDALQQTQSLMNEQYPLWNKGLFGMFGIDAALSLAIMLPSLDLKEAFGPGPNLMFDLVNAGLGSYLTTGVRDPQMAIKDLKEEFITMTPLMQKITQTLPKSMWMGYVLNGKLDSEGWVRDRKGMKKYNLNQEWINSTNLNKPQLFPDYLRLLAGFAPDQYRLEQNMVEGWRRMQERDGAEIEIIKFRVDQMVEQSMGRKSVLDGMTDEAYDVWYTELLQLVTEHSFVGTGRGIQSYIRRAGHKEIMKTMSPMERKMYQKRANKETLRLIKFIGSNARTEKQRDAVDVLGVDLHEILKTLEH